MSIQKNITNNKICHITSAHKRYDKRILDKQCCSLAKNGYNVYLIINDEMKNECYKDVHIVSTGYKFKNRIDRFLKSNKILKKIILEINADIYQLHDPELLRLVKFLKKKGKKVIFDSHEDYPVLIKDKKWIPKILRIIVSKIYLNYEKKIFKILDGIITPSPHIEYRIKKLNNNCIVITNYPIIKKINKNNFEKYICFAGGIQYFWNHKNIIKAISRIDEIKFKIAGKGQEKYINELKNIKGYNKVEMLGFLNNSEIEKLYANASIGMAVCSYIPNMGYKEGSLGNTKLFEYLAAGLPIICTDFTIFKKLIDKYKCGICVNPNSIEEIEEAIKKIINNKELLNQMSKNARYASLTEYNWSTQEKILIEFYNTLIKRNK